MSKIKLNIPCSKERNLCLYVYRSTKATDIDTISKIKDKAPVLTVNEKIAPLQELPNKRQGYIVHDMEQINTGINYIGPEPNPVPVDEYDAVLDTKMINSYTYVSLLKLNSLEVSYNGVMYYYSVIGVDEDKNTMTNLSLVRGVLYEEDYQKGDRELWVKGSEEAEWAKVSLIPWSKDIIIGNIEDGNGLPVQREQPIFSADEISVSAKEILYNQTVEIQLPNVWFGDTYSKRKLKQYKVRNIYDKKIGNFSEPSYTGTVTMPVEKLELFLTEENESVDKDNPTVTIIRRNGIFYDQNTDKNLGLNKYLIEESRGVFSESSAQEFIYTRVPVTLGKTYTITIQLTDVYRVTSKSIQTTFKAVR